jgi:hypothetical protein
MTARPFEKGNQVGRQFQSGNQAALVHGQRSTVVFNSRLPGHVEAIRDTLRESVPALQPIDDLVLERLARVVIGLRLLDEKIDSLGGSWIDSRGRPRAWWRVYTAQLSQFRALCGMLGISPAGRAALMRDAGAGQRDFEATTAARTLRERYTKPALPEGASDGD